MPEPDAAEAAKRKATLVLEHGLRASQRAAESFVASPVTRCLTLAGYQQRIEALRMFGCPLEGVLVHSFSRGLKSLLIPRLAFVEAHACAPQPSFVLVCRCLTAVL